MTANASASGLSSHLITLLASVMLVLQLLLVAQRMLVTNIRLFAAQSLLLAAIAGIVGYCYGAWHVLVIAALTIAGKVFFLPWRLERLVRQIRIEQEIDGNAAGRHSDAGIGSGLCERDRGGGALIPK